MSRYARQEMLPEIGHAGQAKLAKARVLVVGAGGLAAPLLPTLVGAGVGHITLVDPDTVSLSNLHRQTLFREDDVGGFKTQAGIARLSGLNAETRLQGRDEALTPTNAASLVSKADLVLDCADSFAASYILSDACLAAHTPLITASALGFEGYVGGFCASAPSLRAVFPDLPARAATCATAGVMGPVVAMLGATQAQMALSTLLDLDPSPLGQLMMVNMRDFRSTGFRFDGTPEPDDALRFIAPETITPDDFVVDLRGQDETPQPISQNALRISIEDFQSAPPDPGPRPRAVLTCRSGLRAWQAARILREKWNGDISLIAMGDPAPTKKRP